MTDSDQDKIPLAHVERSSSSLTVKDGVLLGAGMLCVSAAAMFYKAKKTTPFKMAYFASWVVMGTALITVISPDKSTLEQELRQKGFQQEIQEQRQLSRLQMDAIRKTADKHKHDNNS